MSDQITFNCIDCGTPVMVDDANPPKDDDVISCTGCRRVFGTYAQIREAMIVEGEKVVNKMIDDANLPDWVTRK